MADLEIEDVRNYPAIPSLELSYAPIRVVHAGVCVAAARMSWRLIERGFAPRYFIDSADVNLDAIVPSNRFGLGDDEGLTTYFDIAAGGRLVLDAAMMMTSLNPVFSEVTEHYSFSAPLLDLCSVGGLPVYRGRDVAGGGWLTPNLTGFAQAA